MTLSPVFPSYSGFGSTSSMSMSKMQFGSAVCDRDITGKSTTTMMEQTVVRVTQEVVRRLVGLDNATGSDPQFDSVYQTVLVIFTRYRTQLDQFVRLLNLTDMETAVGSFASVLERLGDGQQIHCGRVVTVLAFAGCLAQHCIEKEIVSSDDVGRLSEAMGREVASWFIDGRHSLVRIIYRQFSDTEPRAWLGRTSPK